MGLRRTLDRAMRPFGLRVVKARALDLFYQHDYAGGYEEYRAAQIKGNRWHQENRTETWADPRTLSAIADDLEAHGLGMTGCCHGARNGCCLRGLQAVTQRDEVEWLRNRLGGNIIGTDISDTATQYPNMEVWDFHDDNPDWRGRFDFVYTNALDHAFEPARALKTWVAQIVPQGRIYIEHTFRGHEVAAANATDPFGAHPFIMPFLFFEWGRGNYTLADILKPGAKDNNGFEAWVFVLGRAPDLT